MSATSTVTVVPAAAPEVPLITSAPLSRYGAGPPSNVRVSGTVSTVRVPATRLPSVAVTVSGYRPSATGASRATLHAPSTTGTGYARPATSTVTADPTGAVPLTVGARSAVSRSGPPCTVSGATG